MCHVSLEGEAASSDSKAAEQFPEILHYVTEKVSTMMNNCTSVMKLYCTTNCFQRNCYIPKKNPVQRV
jgi:hypothetical protein